MCFHVPLTRLAHQYVQKVIQKETSHPKFKEIYLNGLAIYAVDYYLRCFEIETHLEDRASTIARILSEQSYLEIKGKGKIECRPVASNEQLCYVPIQSWSDRIGYVAVRFNSELTEATLFGFLPIVNTEQIALEKFQPIDDVFNYLSEPQNQVLLSQWLKDAFTTGWQSLDEILKKGERLLANSSGNFAYQFRSHPDREQQKTIKGAKAIALNSSDEQESKLRDIGLNFMDRSVLLIIAIAPENEHQIGIQIRLYPSLEEKYLPAIIHLELLSESGESLRDIIASQYDNWIQLPLIKAALNEKFQIRVSLDDLSVVETFTV
jgi:hypothetical protein